MAYFNKKIRYTRSPQDLIQLGDGVNTSIGTFDIKKSEAVSSYNTLSQNYPSLSVRRGMSTPFTNVTGPINAIGVRNNTEVHILDNTTWKKWNGTSWDTLATGLTNTKSKIFDFVREADRLTILVNGTDRKSYDGTTVSNLWDNRQGSAFTGKTWDISTIVNNKMFVRMTNVGDIGKVGIYDIVEDSWSMGADLGYTWQHMVLVDNIIYTIYTNTGTYYLGAYDTQSDTWNTSLAAPGFSLFGIAAIGKKVYACRIVGNTLMEYDIDGDSWSSLTAPSVTCTLFTSISNTLYFRQDTSPYRIIKYNTTSSAWDVTSGSSPGALWDTGYSVTYNSNIYARQYNSPYAMWIYNTTTNTWDTTTGGSLGSLWQGAAVYLYGDEIAIISQLTSTGVIIKYYILYNSWGEDEVFQSPKTNLYTSSDYRLFALDGVTLKCSDIAIPTEWLFGDSDSITITSMIGAGTAIARYKNMTICFSDNSMHILLGDDTENFRWSDTIKAGCLSSRGHTIHDDTLYFADYNSIKTFSGGIARDISQKVRRYMEGINYTYKESVCMGADDRYIYTSIPYGSTVNNVTLVYDTQTNNWYPIEKGFNEFLRVGEYIYGIDSTTVWRLNSGTTDSGEAIVWRHETGAWFDGKLRQQKVISDIYMLVDLPIGSTLTVSYSTSVDNDDWESLYTFTADADEQNTRVQIPTNKLQSVNWYRLKFSGTGPCQIIYIEPHMRINTV